MSDRRFHSVKQVAELLGIRQHAVLTLINSGQLTAIDVSLVPGGRPRWRIMPDDLDAFIARRKHHVEPPRPRRRKTNPEIKKYF